jgi:hypothetical protein
MGRKKRAGLGFKGLKILFPELLPRDCSRKHLVPMVTTSSMWVTGR